MSVLPRRASLPVLSMLLLAGAAWAAADYRVVDRSKVYHGLADSFSSPATVVSTRVFDTLPAMKKIEEEKVKRDTARWHVLIKEANEQFQKALKTVSKENEYDLIAEEGAVTGSKAIPNVTDQAIAAGARG